MFSGEGDFGREQPIAGFKQFDNPYCVADWPAERIVIRHAGSALTLGLAGE